MAEEMDFEKVSKQTYSFCFRLLRVFSIRWGFVTRRTVEGKKQKSLR